MVTAVSAGAASISVNIEGKTASAAVTVVEPVATVTVNTPSANVQIWGSLTLSVTLRDRNNNVLTGRVVTWRSTDTGIASVDSTGVVSGISPGQVSITATSEGISASAIVVVPPLPALQLTSVSPGTLTRGVIATITGVNFGRRTIDNTVTIAGVSVPVTNVTATQLTLVVPSTGICHPSPAAVSVARAGSPPATIQHPIAVSTLRTLQLGESVLLNTWPSIRVIRIGSGFAGVAAFASEDGGQTFRSTGRNIHVDWHAITFDPNDPDHMLAGTDGGVYASFDAGRSWFAQNNGLAIAQFYQGVSVHPSALWVYGGLQDNNAVYFSGSPVWHNLSSLGDGGSTVVKPSDPTTVYVTHAFLNAIRRITRFGEVARDVGIVTQDRGGNPRPLVMDPLNHSTLYFGTQRLYRTTDEGVLWVPISGDLTRGSGFITSIAIAPSNSQVIYIGTSDGVIAVTLDGGFTYNRFVFAVPRWFTEIAVNPTDPLYAIATASTLGVPHATETRNAGGTFNAGIGTLLPDIPVHSALFVPGTTTFMIGTEFGVLQTTNGGAQWTQGPPGLPSTIVYDLAYAPITGTVFAATHGRGVFAFRPGATPAVLRGDVDGDGRLTAQDALLVQQVLVGMELPPGRSAFPHGDANCDGRG